MRRRDHCLHNQECYNLHSVPIIKRGWTILRRWDELGRWQAKRKWEMCTSTTCQWEILAGKENLEVQRVGGMIILKCNWQTSASKTFLLYVFVNIIMKSHVPTTWAIALSEQSLPFNQKQLLSLLICYRNERPVIGSHDSHTRRARGITRPRSCMINDLRSVDRLPGFWSVFWVWYIGLECVWVWYIGVECVISDMVKLFANLMMKPRKVVKWVSEAWR
jgi:hypothetical protein